MKYLAILFIVVNITLSVKAQLAVYEFTGNSTTENIDVVTQPANAIFSPFIRVGILAEPTADVFNSDNWTSGAQPAINYSKYLEYSVQADAGYYLDIQSIRFFQRGSNAVSNIYRVEVSKDNFATVEAFTEGTIPVAGTNVNWDFPDIQSSVGGKITFRFYVYGTQRADLTAALPSDLGTFRVDNVSTFGQIVAPPPVAVPVSSWGIVISVLAILLFITRKTSLNTSKHKK